MAEVLDVVTNVPFFREFFSVSFFFMLRIPICSAKTTARRYTTKAFAKTSRAITQLPMRRLSLLLGMLSKRETIIVRSGKISSVSAVSIPIPQDLKIVDLAGKTVYPGLIDSFTEQEVSTAELDAGASYWNANIRPQLSTADQFKIDSDLDAKMRKQGRYLAIGCTSWWNH